MRRTRRAERGGTRTERWFYTVKLTLGGEEGACCMNMRRPPQPLHSVCGCWFLIGWSRGRIRTGCKIAVLSKKLGYLTC